MHIPLEGVHNFRDIGGYCTTDGGQLRRGLVFRSGTLTYATDSDRAVFARLGIKTVFDLRCDLDNTIDGPDQPGPGVEVIRAPTQLLEGDVLAVIQEQEILPTQFYPESLPPRAAYHAELFENILAHIDHPLIIHCSAGKDRTGVVIALLMRVAGVRDEDIIANYAETARHMVEPFAVLRRHLERVGYESAAIDILLDCAPPIMEATLAYLDSTFGGVEGYLQQGGMSAEAIQQLRAALIESS